jgi:3-methyladenine DNA glycosylase Mpg
MMPEATVVVEPPRVKLPFAVLTTPRIGITKAADWPLRFVVAGNVHVSGRGSPRRARIAP